jgi:hypothetical protein
MKIKNSTKKVDYIAEKIKERDLLYVSKKDPERLKKLQKEIDFFFYGIE